MRTAVFPGKFNSLAKIGAFVVQAAKEAGLDEKATYAVELAVDEACSNIIEHAYGGEGKGEISCSCQITANGLTIVLKDQGRPFKPDKVPSPNVKVPLNKLNPRGAGLYLIRNMMDDVQFKFSKDEGNVLTMSKNK